MIYAFSRSAITLPDKLLIPFILRHTFQTKFHFLNDWIVFRFRNRSWPLFFLLCSLSPSCLWLYITAEFAFLGGRRGRGNLHRTAVRIRGGEGFPDKVKLGSARVRSLLQMVEDNLQLCNSRPGTASVKIVRNEKYHLIRHRIAI